MFNWGLNLGGCVSGALVRVAVEGEGGLTLGRGERCRGAARLGLAEAYLVWEGMGGDITIAVLMIFFGGGGVSLEVERLRLRLRGVGEG